MREKQKEEEKEENTRQAKQNSLNGGWREGMGRVYSYAHLAEPAAFDDDSLRAAAAIVSFDVKHHLSRARSSTPRVSSCWLLRWLFVVALVRA